MNYKMVILTVALIFGVTTVHAMDPVDAKRIADNINSRRNTLLNEWMVNYDEPNKPCSTIQTTQEDIYGFRSKGN